ncbi:transcobalamin-2 [Pelodytes ibericus]
MAQMWPVLFVLLQFVIDPARLCEIPEGNTRLIQSLNLKLLRTTLDVTTEANPSIYVGLRLSEDHSLRTETNYLQRLKVSLETITSSINENTQEEPTTGLLALHILALKTSCENMETPERKKLITQLKSQLHEEKKNLVLKQRPLSNFYQYSLGILALCVSNKKVDVHVINKLLHAENENTFLHGQTPSIDTEAMAGLAFMCLKYSPHYSTDLIRQINKAVKSVKTKILASQSPDGALGNIYSTPLAVQFLSSVGNSKGTQTCSKAIDTLLEAMKQGKFSNPMMMSQLMPVLHGKSYLDAAKVDCTTSIDNLFISPTTGVIPEIEVGEDLIHVQLIVEGPTGQPFTQSIDVPSRSSLLDILQTAQKQNSKFTFETQTSLYGPYLTMVNGVKSSLEDRTYWQLLKNPNISLIEGIVDYRPEDGEMIILRFSKW